MATPIPAVREPQLLTPCSSDWVISYSTTWNGVSLLFHNRIWYVSTCAIGRGIVFVNAAAKRANSTEHEDAGGISKLQ